MPDSERDTVFIEPFAQGGFELLYCCPVKHAYLQESHINMPWDAGSANKTAEHAWLATLCVYVEACACTYMYLQQGLCAWLLV